MRLVHKSLQGRLTSAEWCCKMMKVIYLRIRGTLGSPYRAPLPDSNRSESVLSNTMNTGSRVLHPSQSFNSVNTHYKFQLVPRI